MTHISTTLSISITSSLRNAKNGLYHRKTICNDQKKLMTRDRHIPNFDKCVSYDSLKYNVINT